MGKHKKSSPNIGFMDIVRLSMGTGILFYMTILALLAAASMTLLIPVSFRMVIDNGLSSQSHHLSAFLTMAALALLLAFTTAMRFYCVSMVGEKIFKTIRQKIFDSVMGFSPYEMDKYMTGDLMSRLVADTGQVRSFAGTSLSVAARNILLLLGGLIMMFITDIRLSVIALAIIPVILIPVFLLGKKLKSLSKQAQDTQSDANITAEEMFFSLETVQNFNHQQTQSGLFSDISHHVYTVTAGRIWVRTLLTFIVIALVFFGVIGILFQGSFAVTQNMMTAGTLTQFIFYTIFTAGAVSSLSEVSGEFQKTTAAYERIREVLHIKPVIMSSGVASEHLPLLGNIVFDDVCFEYTGRADKILNHFSLSITAGQKIGIVGKSGTGKTTLFKLLLRHRNIDSGIITIDGKNIMDYDTDFIRHNMSYVSQDVVLFTGTVFDNIAFGKKNASLDDVIQAAKLAYLDDFIMSLPDGYNTHIGQRGTQLSGGQKQRLTIARAIIKNAPILLLDEATAALDNESEELVSKALNKLCENRTVISITHRLQTLSSMDKIFVMSNGKIINTGTYMDILHKDKIFQDNSVII
jgi:ATP-binding cassette, subfamily B, bacterial